MSHEILNPEGGFDLEQRLFSVANIDEERLNRIDYLAYTTAWKLVNEGVLPADSRLRLSVVAPYQPVIPGSKVDLLDFVMDDIARFAHRPDQMHPEVYELLFGDAPDAIMIYPGFVADEGRRREVYTVDEDLYYCVSALAKVIQERREEQGRTVTAEQVKAKGWHMSTADAETFLCTGLARPMWSNMVRRYHPEWIEFSDYYYVPHTSFLYGVPHTVGKATEVRRVIEQVALSDMLVHQFYEEAMEYGVRGVGPMGKDSLRRLLAEEHPELYEL